jgi:hypothetical protein
VSKWHHQKIFSKLATINIENAEISCKQPQKASLCKGRFLVWKIEAKAKRLLMTVA